MALTSPAPIANDPVRKYAHAPSPTTRQSSTPSDSWNRVGVIRSVMFSHRNPSGARTPTRYMTVYGTEADRGDCDTKSLVCHTPEGAQGSSAWPPQPSPKRLLGSQPREPDSWSRNTGLGIFTMTCD